MKPQGSTWRNADKKVDENAPPHNCASNGEHVSASDDADTSTWWKCAVCGEKYLTRDLAFQVSGEELE